MIPQLSPLFWVPAGVGLYAGLAWVGLLLRWGDSVASPVWPAAGAGIAIVLLGRGWWGALSVFVGAATANIFVLAPLLSWTSVGLGIHIACGNAVAAALGGWLLRRFWARFPPPDFEDARCLLHALREGLYFMLVALVAAGASGLNGSLAQYLWGLVKAQAVPYVLYTWITGDFWGIMCLLPLVLLWRVEGVSDVGKRPGV